MNTNTFFLNVLNEYLKISDCRTRLTIIVLSLIKQYCYHNNINNINIIEIVVKDSTDTVMIVVVTIGQ